MAPIVCFSRWSWLTRWTIRCDNSWHSRYKLARVAEDLVLRFGARRFVLEGTILNKQKNGRPGADSCGTIFRPRRRDVASEGEGKESRGTVLLRQELEAAKSQAAEQKA